MQIRRTAEYLKATFKEFSQDRVLQLSAALAYYATFSIGPLLVLIIGVGSLVLGRRGVQHQLQGQLQSVLGPKTASMLDSMMAASQAGGGLAATIVGGIGLVLGATGIFVQLQQSLNIIWNVEQKPSAGIVGYVVGRALSMLMVLAIGLLLLISMVVSAAISSLSHGWILPNWCCHIVNELVWFGLIAGFFSLIFKYLPLIKIQWRNVWKGALVTSALFVFGKFLLGLYLGSIGAKSAYGAASSFVVFLLFVYYASAISSLAPNSRRCRLRKPGQKFFPTIMPFGFRTYSVSKKASTSNSPGRPRSPLRTKNSAKQLSWAYLQRLERVILGLGSESGLIILAFGRVLRVRRIIKFVGQAGGFTPASLFELARFCSPKSAPLSFGCGMD